jgi:hypothetical protein
MSRRFQFSLSRLLSAVSLFALALCLLRIAFDSEEHRPPAVMLFPIVLGSAIGRLFGRAVVGATVGALVWCLPALLMAIAAALMSLWSSVH